MPAMTDHTVKAFDTDLDSLRSKIAEMGGIAERRICRMPSPRSCGATRRWRRA
jgi:hypothetical protein